MNNWETIGALYRKFYLSPNTKHPVLINDMVEGLAAFKGTLIVWNNGKALPALTTAMRSIIAATTGRYGPNLSMLAQTYHDEPPMSKDKVREVWGKVDAEWRAVHGTKTIWEAMCLKDEEAFLKCLEAYYVLGVLSGEDLKNI